MTLSQTNKLHQVSVSILVFVELALDVQTHPVSGELLIVSILVFVELALDDGPAQQQGRFLLLFQSLFSWNLLLMNIATCAFVGFNLVSILVFVELALDDIYLLLS